jgi:hypothetical protein
MSSRRTFLQSAISTVAGLAGASRLFGMNRSRVSNRATNSTPLPVITPEVKDLAFTIDNGVKVFQFTAEPVRRKIAPWKTIDCWASTVRVPALRSRSIRAIASASFWKIICRSRLRSIGMGCKYPMRWTGCRTFHKSRLRRDHGSHTSSRFTRTERSSITRTRPCSR